MRYHQIVQVWGVLLPVETCMKPLRRAMICLPYLVLLQGKLGNSITVWPLYFVLDTHLIDKLVLLLGIFKLIFCNSRLHFAQKGPWTIEMWIKRPRTRTPTRDAVRRASYADSHAQQSLILMRLQNLQYIMLATSGCTSGHANNALRMLPTLQSAFLDRTEGALGP